MDSTLHNYRGWVFTLGIVFLVAGTLAFLSPGIPGVEKVVQDSYVQKLIFSGGFSLLGTGLSIMGLTKSGPFPKTLPLIGIILGSTGTLLVLITVATHLP